MVAIHKVSRVAHRYLAALMARRSKGSNRGNKMARSCRLIALAAIIALLALGLGWMLLPKSIQHDYKVRWSRQMLSWAVGNLASKGHHSAGRRPPPTLPNSGATPSPPALPRFAICLSGELRTFAATAPSYRTFLEANRDAGVDVFGYIGYDPHPYLAHPYGNGSFSAAENGSAEALAHALAVTAQWPGLLGTSFSAPSGGPTAGGPVKRFAAANEDPWPQLAAKLWSPARRQNQLECARARDLVLQADKVRQCQAMVDQHVQEHRCGGCMYTELNGHIIPNALFLAVFFPSSPCPCSRGCVFFRGGHDYELVVRSRFDLLLPEPLNLTRAAAVASAALETRTEVSSPPTASSGDGACVNHADNSGAAQQLVIILPSALLTSEGVLF